MDSTTADTLGVVALGSTALAYLAPQAVVLIIVPLMRALKALRKKLLIEPYLPLELVGLAICVGTAFVLRAVFDPGIGPFDTLKLGLEMLGTATVTYGILRPIGKAITG